MAGDLCYKKLAEGVVALVKLHRCDEQGVADYLKQYVNIKEIQ